jgi:hypothetical protein
MQKVLKWIMHQNATAVTELNFKTENKLHFNMKDNFLWSFLAVLGHFENSFLTCTWKCGRILVTEA